MSLINEALKKAQRQRAVTPPSDGTAGDAGSGRPIEKRGAPLRVQTLVMAATGAGALIIVSVVVTVLWVNRKVETPVAARPAISTPAKRAESTPEPAPIVVAPLSPPPVANTAVPPKNAAPEPMERVPAPPVATAVPTSPVAETPLPPSVTKPIAPAAPEAPAPATTTPVDEPPPVAAPAPKSRPAPHATTAPQDPRVLSFLDAIRVTGIRSSGTESKVLMNDRVYRVNDIVDRTLGLKLIKVEPEALTFADVNGVVYTKTF